jgi:hypothetical protein
MQELYLTRRDVLDRIHQNPNAVPVVYPDEFGAILKGADVAAVARDAVARLSLPALSDDVTGRLAQLDKEGLVAAIKARRDLIGFLDQRGYDAGSNDCRAAWEVLWDGMRHWDNRQWDWAEIAAGTALADLACPLVEEREAVVLARGSTGH